MTTELKVVVLGSGGADKSAITVQFVQGVFVEKYDPTIEESYHKNVEVDGELFRLEILDTAGTEQFTAMRDLYVKAADVFILLYSTTARATFNDVKDLREMVLNVKDRDDVPMVIGGTKCDLVEDNVVPYEEGATLAEEWNVPFFHVSAKTKLNVNALFEAAVREAMGTGDIVSVFDHKITISNTSDATVPEGDHSGENVSVILANGDGAAAAGRTSGLTHVKRLRIAAVHQNAELGGLCADLVAVDTLEFEGLPISSLDGFAPQLQTVNGVVVKGTSLINLVSLWKFTTAKRLIIDANPKLDVLDGVGWPSSLDELVVSGNDSLTAITGFQGLTNIGRLKIVGCPKLEAITAFRDATAANSITFENCRTLVNVSGFESMKKVGAFTLSEVDGVNVYEFRSLRSVTKYLIIITKNGGFNLSAFNDVGMGGCTVRVIPEEFLPQTWKKNTALTNSSWSKVASLVAGMTVDFDTETFEYSGPSWAVLLLPFGTVPLWMVDIDFERYLQYAAAAMWSKLWWVVMLVVVPVVAGLSVSPVAGAALSAVFTLFLAVEVLFDGLVVADWEHEPNDENLNWGSEKVCGANVPFLVSDRVAGQKVVKTHPNFVAVASLFIQALQLAAFPFNPTFPWPSSVSSAMGIFYLNFSFVDRRDAFAVAFWIAFALAVLLTPILISAAESDYFGLRGPMQFLVPLFFMPSSSALISAMVCTYNDNTGISWLDATLPLDTGDGGGGGGVGSLGDPMQCWTGVHLVYLVCGMFALALSHATTVFGIAAFQDRTPHLQLQVDPKFLVVEAELRFALVVLTSWFSGEGWEWVHITANITLLVAIIALALVMRPAGPDRLWFDLVRVGLMMIALEAAVFSALVTVSGRDRSGNAVYFFVLVALWIVTLIAIAVVGKVVGAWGGGGGGEGGGAGEVEGEGEGVGGEKGKETAIV